ncbi:3'-5' exonuclease [Anaeromyxobacter paludicola]|uniref:3'-5' exonuclease n=1 Tax=Anaeromyxobacter paludicola TaxID=2918171 RepID=A0ABN6NC45_9BACT|nr:3'-5' exonuclease [Anaeromyxobacter paludicola]BDG10819.1 3'-5' exonuclease [Anaeromyxobacter paludicola]
MTRYLVLDLETVPDEALVRAVDGEPERPYAEQVRRIVADRRARGGRSDFLPLPFHRPVAACTLEAVERDGVLEVRDLACWTDRRGGAGERAFLEELWARLAGATTVTFHGRGFDLPVLELRSLKLGVPAPAYFREARGEGAAGHVDLLERLNCDGAATSAPLDLYAKLVGLPGKSGVGGADVQGLYAAGAHGRIGAYCMTDVLQTWLIYLRHRLVDGTLAPEGYERSVAQARDAVPRLAAARLAPEERALVLEFLERCAPFFGEEPERAARVG